ncbi:hypothetical protein D3C78_1769730 [compost metagenome]
MSRPVPNLNSLSLWVNFCEVDVLASHIRLTNLELRHMSDLLDLSLLNTWALLDRFIAYNVEVIAGKRLK